jgi:hypothetical protein
VVSNLRRLGPEYIGGLLNNPKRKIRCVTGFINAKRITK